MVGAGIDGEPTLCARHFRCARAFFALYDFKGDGIANLKVGKCHSLELVLMEEKVFHLAFARDKPESSIRERFNCSGHL